MMSDRRVSQQEVDQLIEDATYLQDEAEALQYVINEVPYDERPPEGKSIAELLLLIDHAQTSFFRPVLEEAVDNPRPTHLENFGDFHESFQTDEEKINNIEKMLRKIAKHRAGVVNVMNEVSLMEWETPVYKNKEQQMLLNFMQGMISFERDVLKEIAEQIKILSQEKETKRDLEKRRMQRQGEQPQKNS